MTDAEFDNLNAMGASPNDPDNLEGLVVAASVALLFILLMLTGCRSIQYVPVDKTHTEYIHTVDSVLKVDSFYHEKETIVMQVDSLAMAGFGVQLKATERAWLVRTMDLERKLDMLQHQRADTLVVRDSIPVIVQVEKPLSRWQNMKMRAGGWAICLCIVSTLLIIIGLIKRRT